MAADPLLTALEASQFQKQSKSKEIVAFLTKLADTSDTAEIIWGGRSAGQRPIVGMAISRESGFPQSPLTQTGKLTIMLLGSQHGSEPSGGEALQIVTRELVRGDLSHYLKHFNFIVVPVSNPDGFDKKRRVNGNGINLSTDFSLISQPETRAVVGILKRFRPNVLLDVHESAILKKKSLGRQGYLTDFEAQFECANHAVVNSNMRSFALNVFLPDLLKDLTAAGLPANRYIGEITDIEQPIKHGGISLRNLRNYAGFQGIFSWLLENRLDPPGTYPTPRNIKVRVEKQYLSVSQFLDNIHNSREKIAEILSQAKADAFKGGDVPVYSHYIPHPTQSTIVIPLRRRDTGIIENMSFNYHGAVKTEKQIPLPAAYAVTGRHGWVADLLDSHGLRYDVILQQESRFGMQQLINKITVLPPPRGKSRLRMEIDTTEEPATVMLNPGDLLIRTDQPQGRLLPLLLDPRSSDSIFQNPAHVIMLARQNPFFLSSFATWPDKKE